MINFLPLIVEIYVIFKKEKAYQLIYHKILISYYHYPYN